MKFIDEISKKYDVSKIESVSGLWFFEMSTPLFSIRHYFFGSSSEKSLFCVSQKNHFDLNGVVKVKSIVENIDDRQLLGDGITLLEVDDLEIGHFDRLVILHGSYHTFFKNDVPSVYPSTNVVFPCHHSEFLPGDSLEEVNFSRNKAVGTLLWERSISPRLRVWFEDATTGVKTLGNAPILSDIEYVFELVTQMNVNGGRMVLENYQRKSVTILFNGNAIRLEGDGFREFNNSDDFIFWVKEFLES